MGVVNSTQQFVTSLGGIIASPIFGTILSNTFNTALKKDIPVQLVAAMDRMPDSIKSVLSNPQALIDAKAQNALKLMFAKYGSAGQALYGQFIQAVKSSLAQGVQRLFLFGLIFAGLTLVSALMLKEIALKRDEFYAPQAVKDTDGIGT